MKDIDRILGILLVLQGTRAATARQLAERFSISTRTVYRDLQTLSLLGVPIYTERGRRGGIRLLEGYFLPPLMFSRGEATALLLGLTLLRSLRAAPFPEEIGTASQKLLAAVPEHLRATLAHLERALGVERREADLFHPEPAELHESSPAAHMPSESAVVTTFLQALLDRNTIQLRYRSPYRAAAREEEAEPLGLFLDRDRWYLVGQALSQRGRRIWRADRVRDLAPRRPRDGAPPDAERFDVRGILGHAWLTTAMDDWRRRAPVRLRVTGEQARRLQQDWYYRHAFYEAQADGTVAMTFGEGDPAIVLALLRWLGPGAELLSPTSWRALLRDELLQMLRQHDDAGAVSAPSTAG